VAADLEVHGRTVRVSDVDRHPVGDVGRREPAPVDEHAVEGTVVDRHPSAVVEAQHQVGSRDQGVRDAHVSTKVAANHDVVPCGEGAL